MSSIKEKVQQLAKEHGYSIASLERQLGFSNGSIAKWDKQSPSADRLQQVADHFDVSVDYLLGRSEKKYWELNAKDERDVQKQLDKMLNGISNDQSLAFFETNGESELSEEDKALLRASLEQTLRLSKELAKKKFTPKKYRN